ncbi:hypothetical protein M9458_042944, partial [Cirrhinus mrigala]
DHQHRALLLLLFHPVPWPGRRPTLAGRRSATDFYYNVHWRLRCNLLYIPQIGLKSPSSLRCLPDQLSDGHLGGPAAHSIHAFTTHFKEVFGRSDGEVSAGEQLYHLKHGLMSTQEYSLRFRTLAAASGWNERSLLTTYRLGLEPKLRLQLAALDDNMGLEKFIQLSLYCSERIQSYQCNQEPVNNALLVLEGANVDIILGRPWLVKHDPILSWGTGEILKWGKGCVTDCFPEIPRPVKKPLPIFTTSVESPIEKRSVQISKIYSSYKDVFCPKRASQLPPHRPWDCAIELVPDAPMPRGKIYPLSLPETKAMEEYIHEALSQGYIRPSTSPAASSFFFVAKKDGGLRPCIDYRIINQGTIKFRYPLPLVPAALEQLRSARIFTKLDLRIAYNLVRIREGDEWKTAFVTPTGHYEYLVMPYGLVNAPSVFQNFIHEVLR